MVKASTTLQKLAFRKTAHARSHCFRIYDTHFMLNNKKKTFSDTINFYFSYVHDNYFLDSETISKTVTTDSNWVQLVYQTFIDNYVPLELFHGLVTCGKAFSLYAINPSENIINVLKTNFTNIPGVGK